MSVPVARYLEPAIREDLDQRMVFLAGPRQVGKTTLAQRLLASEPGGLYLNWDNREDRREIRAARWPGDPALVVLDELHKWRGWKGWLKGEFDKHRPATRFLVTGSARLDVYRRGSDSLQGRYHHYRLHPFTHNEAARSRPPAEIEPGRELAFGTGAPGTLNALLRFGGFPEPFLAASVRAHRRWQKERVERVVREDVRDLDTVRDLSLIQLLADLLPDRVGSPLSLNALREDLESSHRALTHWMDVLERLYYAVRIRPFESSRVRSLRRMPKAYLWDWSEVTAPGPRFENMVAMHLLKLCHYLEDKDGFNVELRYLRDRAGREVDFLVTLDRKPWFAVEAKLTETAIDPSLVHFRDRLKIPFVYQVVLDAGRDVVQNGVRCLPAAKFLSALV
jgi:predicted AAA+ superfamily ATPase